jgi:rhodanese-related sulfurtransferase
MIKANVHRYPLILALLLTLLTSTLYAADDEYPGRIRYPDIQHIEIDALHQRMADVKIVDVRSELEFNTLHVKGAINIPLNAIDFSERMKTLQTETGVPLVTYCNGKTCMKSYKAARKAIDDGMSSETVIVFDSGIFDWTMAHPEESVLLGESPVDTGRLLSKQQLADHMLSVSEFSQAVNHGKGIVLDIRDNQQRMHSRLFLGIEEQLAISDIDSLKKYVAQSNAQRKPLYIYDNTGKQVRWLMYQLEAQGAKEYYFMKDGAYGYFRDIQEKLFASK